MSENGTVPGHRLDEEIYQRLFERRTLLLGEPLEHWNSNRLCSALILLSAEDPTSDIRLLINSPGGSVPGMLAIRDCMRAIPNDVVTVNVGMAYSAGQFLLSAGTHGKRYIAPNAKVLLHQGSAGIGGTAMDIAIQADDLRRTRDTVLALIAADTGQDVSVVERDSRRDRWFSATEALDYGFVDHIIQLGDDILPSTRRTVGLGLEPAMSARAKSDTESGAEPAMSARAKSDTESGAEPAMSARAKSDAESGASR